MINKEILIIVPSRAVRSPRWNNVSRFRDHWLEHTEGRSDLCIALDDDDHHNYPRLDNVIYVTNPRLRMIPTLNLVATSFAHTYKYVAFFGDDHVIRSKWETAFINYCESNTSGVGICYGNDLLQGQNLPTAVFMSTNIINTLGYMVPPGLLHMYADNFWLDLGNQLGIIKYFPDVIFEHLHPDVNKVSRDEQYIDAASVAGRDSYVYSNYVNSEMFINDIQKVKNIITTNDKI